MAKELTESEFKRTGDAYKEMDIQVSIPEWSEVFPVDIVHGEYKDTEKIVIFCDLSRFPIDHLQTAPKLELHALDYTGYPLEFYTSSLKETIRTRLLCYL